MILVMTMEELTRGIHDCDCKKDHSCPIDYIKIGSGALEGLPSMCKEYNSILLVSDENTYRVCGKRVYEMLGNKVSKNLILAPQREDVIPNEEKIAEIEKEITSKTDLIIGVGSGVINDLCKYVSHKHNLYYYIVATATSMDGYASVGSALILKGMKVTLNARPPKAIVADTAVLKDAPISMLRAGYGDILGKYSCLNDWKLSTLINGEYFCQRVYDLTMECVKRVEKLAEKIGARDEEAVGALMEALVIVGIAMSYVDCSRPASGSEHHLSHFFEITGILDKKDYFMHGIDVAYSSVVTAALREELLKSTPVSKNFDRAAWEKEIRRIYGTSAGEVIALQDKMGWYNENDLAVINEKWEDIQKVLREAPTAEETRVMMERVGLNYTEFEKLYGNEKINDAVLYAKDLKDRYSVLWLAYKYFEL